MNKTDLPELAKTKLKAILQQNGEVIYSSHETLKKGDIYLMGFNPGGAGFISIEKHIDKMLDRIENSYLDESWKNGNSHYAKGQAPLQKRIVWLLNQLGVEPRDVCASNLIFQTSRHANSVPYSLAEMCWPVHKAVIDIVKPQLLIVFGNGNQNSPYAFLKNKFLGVDDPPIKTGHGNWTCKGFQTTIDSTDLYVAGLPHLSRFDPQKIGEGIQWLKSKLRTN